jgi:hypothetical protein
MSITIDLTAVRSVLLADGWHRVAEKSFAVGPYQYVRGGTAQAEGVAVGFRFKDDAGYILTGPLSAILASQAAS